MQTLHIELAQVLMTSQYRREEAGTESGEWNAGVRVRCSWQDSRRKESRNLQGIVFHCQ